MIYHKRCPVFVEDGEICVTSPFGYRVNPVNGIAEGHKGVDITRWVGWSTTATICAFDEGEVIKVGFDHSRGNNVSVDHRNGYVSMYFHLADSSIRVKPGDLVRKGQTIGYMGSTGQSTGAHLHFQLEKEGVPVDGLPYLLGEMTMEGGDEEEDMIRYKYLKDIPNDNGFRDVIARLMDAKIINGDGSDPYGNNDVIDLSHDQVRSLVFEYRGGAFDRQFISIGMQPVVTLISAS